MRNAVVLFNLGGPAGPNDIGPFLYNLFSDPAILRLPAPLRLPLAGLIARLRRRKARAIYDLIGGGSPILGETMAQADALALALGAEWRAFVAMRYAAPRLRETLSQLMAYCPDQIVLLPLYPHYSTTTTASSFLEWDRLTRAAGLHAPTLRVERYPTAAGFLDALADLTRRALGQCEPRPGFRYLFTAHGLPEKIVAAGDPYPREVEQTAAGLAARLGCGDFRVCYQSRVGPLKWLGPSTEAEIVRAGAEKLGVVMVPISFVSEHSETLVELDIQYAALAREAGVRDYVRVPCVGTHPAFIAALADKVRGSNESG